MATLSLLKVLFCIAVGIMVSVYFLQALKTTLMKNRKQLDWNMGDSSTRYVTFEQVAGTSYHVYNHSAVQTLDVHGRPAVLILACWQHGPRRSPPSEELCCLTRDVSGRSHRAHVTYQRLSRLKVKAVRSHRYYEVLIWCHLPGDLEVKSVALVGETSCTNDTVNSTFAISMTTQSALASEKAKVSASESEISGRNVTREYFRWLPVSRVAANRRNATSSGMIAVCLKHMYNVSQPAGLAQWLEMLKLMGVTKVILYGYSGVSDVVHRLLQYYQQTLLLEVKAWQHQWVSGSHRNSRADILRDAQRLAYSDCIHRHQMDYDYMMFHDLDEFIFPPPGAYWKTFQELMAGLQRSLSPHRRVCAFTLNRYRFCSQHSIRTISITDKQLYYDINVMQQSRHHKQGRVKSVVRPREVLVMGIHEATCRPGAEQQRVLPSTASMHHYSSPHPQTQCHIHNPAARRFSHQLRQKVASVLLQVMSRPPL